MISDSFKYFGLLSLCWVLWTQWLLTSVSNCFSQLLSLSPRFPCVFLLLQWLCIAYWFDWLSKTQFVKSYQGNGCLDICPWGTGMKWLIHFTNINNSSLILKLFTAHGLGLNVSSLLAPTGFSHHTLCSHVRLKFGSLSYNLGICLQC